MNDKKKLGIYVHIPFCIRKCLYCDFLSDTADTNVRQQYIEALINEIDSCPLNDIDYKRHSFCWYQIYKDVTKNDDEAIELFFKLCKLFFKEYHNMISNQNT